MKILVAILTTLFILGCSQEKRENDEVVNNADSSKIEVTEEKSALESAKEKATEVKDELSDKISEVKESAEAKAKELADNAKETLDEQVQNVQDVTQEVVETVEEEIAAVTDEESEIDVGPLYNKCATCHGGMGERSALNKSAVIRNWSVKQIESAILGYQNGTYGRTMKAMMQKQVEGLTPEEVHALAEYISDK